MDSNVITPTPGAVPWLVQGMQPGAGVGPVITLQLLSAPKKRRLQDRKKNGECGQATKAGVVDDGLAFLNVMFASQVSDAAEKLGRGDLIRFNAEEDAVMNRMRTELAASTLHRDDDDDANVERLSGAPPSAAAAGESKHITPKKPPKKKAKVKKEEWDDMLLLLVRHEKVGTLPVPHEVKHVPAVGHKILGIVPELVEGELDLDEKHASVWGGRSAGSPPTCAPVCEVKCSGNQCGIAVGAAKARCIMSVPLPELSHDFAMQNRFII